MGRCPRYDFTNQFSIALWLKPSASDPSSIQTILANSNSGYSTDGIRLYYNSWNTTDHALNLETGDSDIHTDSGAITVGAWNQLSLPSIRRPARDYSTSTAV